ncbi:MAG TPA: M24 family metallopeptidase [Gemmatimonadaceae bacterium]
MSRLAVDKRTIFTPLRPEVLGSESAVIREATRLAGLGIMEAMRDAEPGLYEYEPEAAAEYVYKRGGAYGESYFPLIATGANMPYTHYHKNRARLKDGDLVQFDASYPFTDPKIKSTAESFVNRYRPNPNERGGGSLGHSVGMEVHDVRNPTPTLEPGYVFRSECAQGEAALMIDGRRTPCLTSGFIMKSYVQYATSQQLSRPQVCRRNSFGISRGSL